MRVCGHPATSSQLEVKREAAGYWRGCRKERYQAVGAALLRGGRADLFSCTARAASAVFAGGAVTAEADRHGKIRGFLASRDRRHVRPQWTSANSAQDTAKEG